MLVAADTPYRVSFPGAIGDRALTYAMGHGQACMRVTIGGEAQPVLREFTRAA